ncbi:unnamed protein product, partial [Prorocentrum cordatum]
APSPFPFETPTNLRPQLGRRPSKPEGSGPCPMSPSRGCNRPVGPGHAAGAIGLASAMLRAHALLARPGRRAHRSSWGPGSRPGLRPTTLTKQLPRHALERWPMRTAAAARRALLAARSAAARGARAAPRRSAAGRAQAGLEISSLNGPFGAVVRSPLSAEAILGSPDVPAALVRAFLDFRGLLVLRGLGALLPEQLLAISRFFGQARSVPGGASHLRFC